jgi:hypothetical protein
LINILKGGRFDSDRHGAQLRIKNNDIYLFDWGNMLLQPPSDEELGVLGHAIVNVFIGLMGGEPLSGTLSEVAGESTYLLEVQKALLSLEDFRQYIEPEDDNSVLMKILGIALQSAHPTIIKAVMDRAMELSLDATALQQFVGASSLSLEIVRPTKSRRRLRRYR